MADDGFKDLVLQQLADIKERVNTLPCSSHGEDLAALKQSLANHKDLEVRDLNRKNLVTNIWRIVLTIISLVIAGLVAVDKFR